MTSKLHIEVVDVHFPGETQRGAAQLIAKVRAAVNIRFQDDAVQPYTLMMDRGKGSYHIPTGKITALLKPLRKSTTSRI